MTDYSSDLKCSILRIVIKRSESFTMKNEPWFYRNDFFLEKKSTPKSTNKYIGILLLFNQD